MKGVTLDNKILDLSFEAVYNVIKMSCEFADKNGFNRYDIFKTVATFIKASSELPTIFYYEDDMSNDLPY